jgi:hypothetical protein
MSSEIEGADRMRTARQQVRNSASSDTVGGIYEASRSIVRMWVSHAESFFSASATLGVSTDR